MNQHQAAQAISIAAAHTVDRYTVPNDVTYLVLNGIDPDDAARRVVAHRRRLVIWGFAVAGSLLWIGATLGWAARLLVLGVGGFLLEGRLAPLQLMGAGLCAAIGIGWSYLLLMSAVWSWRHAARGCAWEDSRRPWWPSRRPAQGDAAPVAPAEGRLGPMLIGVVGLLLVAGFVVVPVVGGLLSGVTELVGS